MVDIEQARKELRKLKESGISYVKVTRLAPLLNESTRTLGAHIARNPEEWPLEDSGFGHPTTYRITLSDE